jgi:hypothetical protein
VHKGLGRPGADDNSAHPLKDEGSSFASTR